MKNIFFILMFLFCSVLFGQELLNNYKYIIVPKQFDNFKEQNQYQTSTLLKFLFVEKGFNVVYDDKLPIELKTNRCNALVAEIEDNSNMFTTKTTITLKDCESMVVFKTREGISKTKEFKGAYSEAIRDAFRSFSNYTYEYSNSTSEPIKVSIENYAKSQEIEQPIESTKVIEIEQAEIETAVVDVKTIMAEVKSTPIISESSLYAQSILNGYQLVDNTPKIIMKIYKTTQATVFLGEETSGANGLVFNRGGVWIFEYYENEKLKEKQLDIKF